jgi:predicted transcriptional regulator
MSTNTNASTKDSQVSMRLPTALKDKVQAYALLTGRSKSHVAMEALAHYLDERVPQVQDLQQAVAAADRGEFASDAQVQAVMAKYTTAAPKAATPSARSPRKRA